ncbi:MAG: hypothetical protein RLZZ590_218 [Actinomycetota bacterium]|jgi:uncharacterized protein (UPF0303 family)
MTDQAKRDIESIRRQEELLVFETFDQNTAWQLGSLLRERAVNQNWPIVIDIRAGETPLFYAALPGTTPANSDWARRKRNLVNKLEISSYAINLHSETDFDAIKAMALDPRDHAAAGGCVPIRVKGAGMVATCTVSGLPQRDDHKVVVEAIADLLGVSIGDAAL